MLLKIGYVIKDTYEIVDIKRGGMGTVYICRLKPLARAIKDDKASASSSRPDAAPKDGNKHRVALKSVSSDFYFSGRNAEQFNQEALIWSILPPHPYIISCNGVDRLESAPVIFLEYAPGGSLRERIGKGDLSLQETLRLARQVCAGMEFLAACGGIVHQDLKPENLLLGDTGDVKITDFGLASVQRYGMRVLLGGHSDESLSPAAARRYLGGTLPYMSPEHFGVGEVTVRSDIYGFGAIIFEMLEGRLLFDNASADAFRHAHLHEKPPRLSQSAGPRRLGAVLAKCTEKTPSRRFADFGELDEALADIIIDERLDIPEPLKLTVEEAESKINATEWANRGYGLAKLSRFEESLRCYQRAYDLDPQAFPANMHMGTALGRVGRGEESLAYYEKEVELHPEEAFAHAALANEYARRGRLADAAEQLSMAVDCDPQNMSFRRQLAATYRHLGRHAESDDLVEQIVRMHVDDPERFPDESWVNEGLHFGLMGDLTSSLRMFDHCVQRYPDNINCWYNRAVTLFVMGDVDGAIRSAKRALTRDADLAQARFLLGMLHLAQQDPIKAAVEWQRLRLRNPGHRYAIMIEPIIEPMQGLPPQQVLGLLMSLLNIPSDLYYR